MDLTSVRVDVHRFHTARARADIARHAGRPARSTREDLKEAPLAADPESLALVRQEAVSSTGRRLLRLQRLEERVVRNIAQAAWAGTADSTGHTRVHSALDLLSHTADRAERLRLEASASASSEPCFDAWARRIDAAQAGGLDLSKPAAQARSLLADTDAMYADVLTWWLRRSVNLKPFPRGADAHDVLWALNSLPFDALVRRGDILGLPAKFASTGLSDERLIDDEAREGRHPGALVRAADAPDEVLASHRARGGFDDARAALGALGAGWHWAGVDVQAPPEDRLLGDPAIRASTGVALARLLFDPLWAKKHLGVEDPDFLRVLALADLAQARLEAAALVATQEALQRGALISMRDSLADGMSRATLGQWSPGLVALLPGDPFDAAGPLTARWLGASLFQGLRERCNEDWWANPRTGAFLASFFTPGGLYAPDELAAHGGLPPLEQVSLASVWSAALD